MLVYLFQPGIPSGSAIRQSISCICHWTQRGRRHSQHENGLQDGDLTNALPITIKVDQSDLILAVAARGFLLGFDAPRCPVVNSEAPPCFALN